MSFQNFKVYRNDLVEKPLTDEIHDKQPAHESFSDTYAWSLLNARGNNESIMRAGMRSHPIEARATANHTEHYSEAKSKILIIKDK